MDDIDKKWDEIMPHILHYNETVNREDLHTVNSKIREYYFGEKTVNRDIYGDLVQVSTNVLPGFKNKTKIMHCNKYLG